LRHRKSRHLTDLLILVVWAGCATHPATKSTDPKDGRPSRGVFEGRASWYGKEQHGHLTASGERFDMYALTAAHRSLRMNTRVRVINLRNGRHVVVRINDRGPFGKGRIIDLSYAAAKVLGMLDAGVVPVRIEVVP
jgi:rare lipoprotein A